MQNLTAEDVVQMTVAERLDHIANLSPGMERLIQHARDTGMCDTEILEHFKAARDIGQIEGGFDGWDLSFVNQSGLGAIT